jgi:hypothetical protein
MIPEVKKSATSNHGSWAPEFLNLGLVQEERGDSEKENR